MVLRAFALQGLVIFDLVLGMRDILMQEIKGRFAAAEY
jgi:hypothetical protein